MPYFYNTYKNYAKISQKIRILFEIFITFSTPCIDFVKTCYGSNLQR